MPIRRLLLLACLFCIVFGARLWLIKTYTTPVPYRDQWDGEAMVIKSWIEGHLTPSLVFAPHNEHRIVLTRALTLMLFAMNHQWDPQLEMIVNAFICGLIAVCAALVLLRRLPSIFHWPVMLTVTGLFALPYAWENTLCGFQSQFYFLLFFSLVAMWGMGLHMCGSRAWYAGCLGLVLSLLSMASGFFSACAIIAFLVARAFAKRKLPRESAISEVITGVVCLIDVAAGVLMTSKVPAHAFLKAESLSAWVIALGRVLAWPFPGNPVYAVWIQLPFIGLLALYFSGLEALQKKHFFRQIEVLIVVGFWTILQAAAMAYARGGGNMPPASRYQDLLALNAA
ncbi:MAG: hypothetical protein WCD79_14815, partial [Chthoniobacteraceae bacterium]